MRNTLKNWTRLGLPGCLAVVALAGCTHSPMIQGKVISGNLSFIAVVDAGDERLQEDGLAGVDIAARTASGQRTGALLGQTETDQKGNFRLRMSEQTSVMRPVEFSADVQGYQTARAEMNLPSSDRKLLIILAPGQRGAGSGSR